MRKPWWVSELDMLRELLDLRAQVSGMPISQIEACIELAYALESAGLVIHQRKRKERWRVADDVSWEHLRRSARLLAPPRALG